MSEFYSALMIARHFSDFIGPSSGAFCTSCIRRLWYVVLLCVLLDTRSETCRANICAEQTYSLRPHCVSCWTTYILQDDTRSLQCQVKQMCSRNSDCIVSEFSYRFLTYKSRIVLYSSQDLYSTFWARSHTHENRLFGMSCPSVSPSMRVYQLDSLSTCFR